MAFEISRSTNSIESVPFRSRSHFGQREWIATVLSRFPLRLIAAPLPRPPRDLETTSYPLIISLGRRKIRTRKFVGNGYERGKREKENTFFFFLSALIKVLAHERISKARFQAEERRKSGLLKSEAFFLLSPGKQRATLEVGTQAPAMSMFTYCN